MFLKIVTCSHELYITFALADLALLEHAERIPVEQLIFQGDAFSISFEALRQMQTPYQSPTLRP